MSRFPNGNFASLSTADAGIQAMCSFVMEDGTMAGVIVGGNFTSLGEVESQGIALFDPNTTAITPLTGLSGQVSALLCDQDTNTVYVGGSFRGANSTNAIAWVGTAGWTNLPFAGFNGPVTSISKASDGNIIFGGTFTGLGNVSSPNDPDQQIINIATANVSAVGSTSTSGFSDPNNIICQTSGTDGSGTTWLLEDNTAGSWAAAFGYNFSPTKLRLYNTHQDGRGTQTWRYNATPNHGIMNFTYIDPATGANRSCTAECPLSSNSSIEYQDFHFVNVIDMNGFSIDISTWYGSGGGLNGIALFENDINAYAISSFNEPSCASIDIASNATFTGPWTVTPSLQSSSEYLTTTYSAGSVDTSNVVTFMPDIKQSGNYSVNIYTPGCIADDTCSSRGQVNITGVMSSDGGASDFEVDLFQTNYYDKYDQIYFGYIEAASDSFRPKVYLSAASGQSSNLTVVAQRVGFSLISSSGGLNGLYEYNPNEATVSNDFSNSTFDEAGTKLETGAGVHAMATSGTTTFIGGNFSNTDFNYIIAVDSNGAEALTGGGLNSEVHSMYINDTTLYVGGNFTGTNDASTTGLNNIATYDVSTKTWSALGAGVNGRVCYIVPLSLNITANTPETVITLTGNFNTINAFGSNASIPADGFAVWVPSRNNWIQNLGVQTMLITGQLTAAADIPSGGTLFGGSLSSQTVSANGVVSLQSGLAPFPVNIQASTQSTSTSSKRATVNVTGQDVSGVTTGLFYQTGGSNVTVLAGHFTAKATNGSEISNLLFIDGSNSDSVTGLGGELDSDSTFLAVAIQGNTLYAGGTLSGTANGADVGGLISYNMKTSDFTTQPPALNGGTSTVEAIATRPDTGDVYVGGDFIRAGSLNCPAVCYFTTSTSQWNRPGGSLGGTATVLVWTSKSTLVAGGDLTIDGVKISLASYDAKKQIWSDFDGADVIPGPITALTAGSSDSSQLWVAGTATNGSAYLMKYDGGSWNSVGDTLGSQTTIRGLQMFTTTKSHSSTNLVSSSQSLMVLGSINVPGFGNASAVTFNGTTFQPYALTSNSASSAGSLASVFSQEQNFFTSPGMCLSYSSYLSTALTVQ